MSGMSAARKQLAADLEEVGFFVSAFVPEKVVPPLVCLRAVSPMLEPDSVLSETEVIYRLGLLIIVADKGNEQSIEELEEAVENVLLNLGDWSMEAVGQPFYAVHNGMQFPTVEISIINNITIEGGE